MNVAEWHDGSKLTGERCGVVVRACVGSAVCRHRMCTSYLHSFRTSRQQRHIGLVFIDARHLHAAFNPWPRRDRTLLASIFKIILCSVTMADEARGKFDEGSVHDARPTHAVYPHLCTDASTHSCRHSCTHTT